MKTLIISTGILLFSGIAGGQVNEPWLLSITSAGNE